jgi:hypothetical protein
MAGFTEIMIQREGSDVLGDAAERPQTVRGVTRPASALLHRPGIPTSRPAVLILSTSASPPRSTSCFCFPELRKRSRTAARFAGARRRILALRYKPTARERSAACPPKPPSPAANGAGPRSSSGASVPPAGRRASRVDAGPDQLGELGDRARGVPLSFQQGYLARGGRESCFARHAGHRDPAVPRRALPMQIPVARSASPCGFAQIHASDALHPCNCFCSRASAGRTIPKATSRSRRWSRRATGRVIAFP